MSNISLTPAKYAQQLEQAPEADSPEDHAESIRAAAHRLHSNPAATIGDLFRVADALGIDAGDLMRMRNRNA